MGRNQKYSQQLVDWIHADRRAGVTLRELQDKHRNLTINQLTYILYSRRPTAPAAPPTDNNAVGGSAPPKGTLWTRLKSMLGFS